MRRESQLEVICSDVLRLAGNLNLPEPRVASVAFIGDAQ